jgi:hypothetical protein
VSYMLAMLETSRRTSLVLSCIPSTTPVFTSSPNYLSPSTMAPHDIYDQSIPDTIKYEDSSPIHNYDALSWFVALSELEASFSLRLLAILGESIGS